MVRNRTTTSCDIKGCLIPFHFPAVDQMTACFNVTLMLQLSFVTKRWMYGKIFIKSACVSSHSNVPFIIISSSGTIFQIQKHRKKCKYMKCMNISEITISYYLRLVTYLFFYLISLWINKGHMRNCWTLTLLMFNGISNIFTFKCILLF